MLADNWEIDFAVGYRRAATMPRLNLELSEETYMRIVATAKKLGMSAEEWAERRLRTLSLTVEQRTAAKERILKYAGCFESARDVLHDPIERDR